MPRDFDKLWVGQSVSELGSHFTGTGLPLTAILVLGARPAEMGLLAAAGAVGVIAAAPLAGVWVDRLPRRRVLIASDLGRALALLAVPALAFAAALRMEHLYLIAFGVAALGTFFEVAYRSALPSLVPRDELVRANGRLATSSSVAEVAGPATAGAFVQALSAPVALLVDAASFVVSAISVALIRPLASPARVAGTGALSDLGDGIRSALSLPVVRALLIGALFFSFFGNMIGALYALYGIRDLGLSPFAVGALVSLGGLSAIPGSLVAHRVARRLGLGRATAVTLFLYGCLGIVLPVVSGPPLLAFAVLGATQLLGDWLVAIHLVSEVSLRQSATPDALLGRVNAAMHFVVLGIGPLGALVAGAIAEAYGIRAALALGVGGVILAGAWLLVSPVRRAHEA